MVFQTWFLGYSHIEDKEGLRKMITSKKLDYNLRFYFYRPGFWLSNRSGLST